MKRLILIITCIILVTQLFSQSLYDFYDTINFEHPSSNLVIGTSAENIWQIGKPGKLFFDSAYTYSNAIVTDTINYYPINNYSYFELKFNFDLFKYSVFHVSFEHKFDTDTLKDGGYLNVSHDNGNTWFNIIEDEDVRFFATPKDSNEYLYSQQDTLFNGEKGFSGHSEGWISVGFEWFHYSSKKNLEQETEDASIIRFNFISDSIPETKEGWLIDHIMIYGILAPGMIYDYGKSEVVKVYPNPVSGLVTLEFSNPINTDYLLTIYNNFGQSVLMRKVSDEVKSLVDMGLYPPGLYLFKLSNLTNGQVSVVRILNK